MSSRTPGPNLGGVYVLALDTGRVEQVLQGQHAEDTNLGNNQFPFEPPQYVPVEFEVRPGAAEIRCSVPSFVPGPEPRR